MIENSGDKKQGFINKQKIKKLIFNLFIITFLVIITKLFFIETIIVSSVFMEGTLRKGDYLLIDKTAYKLRFPHQLPFLNSRLGGKTIFNISSPKRGDLFYLKLDRPNFYNLENLLARCVGVPGDTLMMMDKDLFVNSVKKREPEKTEHYRNYSIPFGVEEKEFYFNNRGWNQDNFGPLIVPKKEDKIKLSTKNIEFYKDFILRDDVNNSIKVEGERIYIKNRETKYYKIKNNYFFVLGDNRELAIDSRYIGFIKESSIIGKAGFVYWSVDKEKNLSDDSSFLFGSVRWDRILYFLK